MLPSTGKREPVCVTLQVTCENIEQFKFQRAKGHVRLIISVSGQSVGKYLLFFMLVGLRTIIYLYFIDERSYIKILNNQMMKESFCDYS